MNIVGIVQARMGSSRLPGKVLQDVMGEPLLVRTVERVACTQTLNKVVIATTVQQNDAAIVKLCQERDWGYFCGSEHDVLDRYYQAAKMYAADVVVRITSDCPLMDPAVVDLVVETFLAQQPLVDYAANTLMPRTFPRGLDTEVFNFEVLERAWREDDNPAWREHVTPYIYRHPELFHLYSVISPEDYSYMRWTVDTAEDLAFVRQIYAHFGEAHFSWQDTLTALQKHPEWLEINRDVLQKVI